MSIGISSRQRQNNAVATEKAVVVKVVANTIAGTAQSLMNIDPGGRDGVIKLAGFVPSAILISNNSVASIYIRTASSGAGEGVVIQPNGSMFMPIVGGTDLLVENANSIYVLCYE